MKVNISVRLEASEVAALDAHASRQGLKRATLATDLLAHAIRATSGASTVASAVGDNAARNRAAPSPTVAPDPYSGWTIYLLCLISLLALIYSISAYLLRMGIHHLTWN